MVKLITSIADQTNLLALNATIEAARAGDPAGASRSSPGGQGPGDGDRQGDRGHHPADRQHAGCDRRSRSTPSRRSARTIERISEIATRDRGRGRGAGRGDAGTSPSSVQAASKWHRRGRRPTSATSPATPAKPAQASDEMLTSAQALSRRKPAPEVRSRPLPRQHEGGVAYLRACAETCANRARLTRIF